MEHFLPQIYWHDRTAILSVDIHHRNTNVYKMVTSSMQKEVRIWEFTFEHNSEKNEDELIVSFVANLTSHNSSVNSVQFSPSTEVDMLASGDSGGRVIVWTRTDAPAGPPDDPDLPPNKENWIRAKHFYHEHDVCAVAWAPDGVRLASVARDNALLVHQMPLGKRLQTVRCLGEFPNGLAWDPSGKYIVTMSTDRKLNIIFVEKGTKLRTIQACELPAMDVLGTPIEHKTYRLFHDDQMFSFKRQPAFSPCANLLVVPSAHLEVGADNLYGTYVYFWSQTDKDKPAFFHPFRKAVFMIKMCPVLFALSEGENYSGLPHRVLWVVLADNAVVFYDSQHSSPIGLIENIHYNKLTEVAWSWDGSRIVISSMEGFCSFVRIHLDRWGVKLESTPITCQSPNLLAKYKENLRKKTKAKPATKEKEGGSDAEKTPKTPKTPCTPRSSAITPKSKSLHNFFGTKENMSANTTDTPKRITDAPNLTDEQKEEQPKKKRVQLISIE